VCAHGNDSSRETDVVQVPVSKQQTQIVHALQILLHIICVEDISINQLCLHIARVIDAKRLQKKTVSKSEEIIHDLAQHQLERILVQQVVMI